MKKIPTMFIREFQGHKIVGIKNEFTSPECEQALINGRPTIKFDGACCMIDDSSKLWIRYDAKPGRKVPEGAVPCCDPDPVTGHWPHWVPADANPDGYKWYTKAFEKMAIKKPGTYEAVGKHFNGNPYCLETDFLIRHGSATSGLRDDERSFEGIKEYLNEIPIEGIVFWVDGEPVCKIKRTDFGYEWPLKNAALLYGLISPEGTL